MRGDTVSKKKWRHANQIGIKHVNEGSTSRGFQLWVVRCQTLGIRCRR